ncbi:hypothetical protein IWZ03DRAFT_385932 [Phyllosticta citriasiana]|uniref:Uncharacterized protein n=1 Tax=Phyllosticta citriasiana TaxID=595635 RepID=A0ABR1KCR3_9PEZI
MRIPLTLTLLTTLGLTAATAPSYSTHLAHPLNPLAVNLSFPFARRAAPASEPDSDEPETTTSKPNRTIHASPTASNHPGGTKKTSSASTRRGTATSTLLHRTGTSNATATTSTKSSSSSTTAKTTAKSSAPSSTSSSFSRGKHCPYPYPGERCHAPKTTATSSASGEKTTSTSGAKQTETSKAKETPTATGKSSGFPYPGQEC